MDAGQGAEPLGVRHRHHHAVDELGDQSLGDEAQVIAQDQCPVGVRRQPDAQVARHAFGVGHPSLGAQHRPLQDRSGEAVFSEDARQAQLGLRSAQRALDEEREGCSSVAAQPA